MHFLLLVIIVQVTNLLFYNISGMSENKVTSKNEDADNKFKIQLRVVKKIIKNILVVSKHRFPQILVYQITKFVFKNPLRFRKTLYCRNTLNELKVNTQYLLRRTSNIIQNQYQNQMQKARDLSLRESAKKDERQKEKDKVWVNKDKNTSEYTSYITIIKSWKATIVNQNDYNQVLQKARLFFVFLSSIKLFLGKQIYKDSDSNPLTDFHNYQNKQKELNKYHHLICDHFQLYYSYFQQIFKYQKDKKLNVVVIKAFISLMSKNMSLVKIEQNYNTESLQCESKYLYIESKEEIPLKCKRADDQERFPSLKIQGGQWIMVHQRGNYIFEVFQEVTYPLPWGRNSYLTRQMTATTNIDVWVQQGQQNF